MACRAVEHRPVVEVAVQFGGWTPRRPGEGGNDLPADVVEVVELGSDRLR